MSGFVLANHTSKLVEVLLFLFVILIIAAHAVALGRGRLVTIDERRNHTLTCPEDRENDDEASERILSDENDQFTHGLPTLPALGHRRSCDSGSRGIGSGLSSLALALLSTSRLASLLLQRDAASVLL